MIRLCILFCLLLSFGDGYSRTIKISKKDLETLKRKQRLATEAKTKKKVPVLYKPAPVISNQDVGFVIGRDSAKIKEIRLTTDDELNAFICERNGVTFTLAEDFNETIQEPFLDDLRFIEARILENKRSVYIRLKEPIPVQVDPKTNKVVETVYSTSLRLPLKSNDKNLLINIYAKRCPPGVVNPYPRIYRISEKKQRITPKSEIMSPTDKIITLGEGFVPKNKNVIRIYDAVMASGSDYISLSIEIQYPKTNKDTSTPVFKVLNNLQLNLLKSYRKLMPEPSRVYTEINGVPTLRFNLFVKVNKNYILNNRYIYIMTLFGETSHYQYQPLDLKPYMESLVRRGLKL